MNICEMQQELELRTAAFQRAYQDSVQAVWRVNKARGKKVGPEPKDTKPKKAGGIGKYYCTFIAKYLHVPAAEAAEVPASMRVVRQDTSKKKPATPAAPSALAAQQQQPKSDSVMVLLPTGLFKKVPRNKIPAGSFIPETAAAHASPAVPMPKAGAAPPTFVRPTIAPAVGSAIAGTTSVAPATAADSANRANAAASASLAHPLTAEEAAADPNTVAIEVTDAKIRLDDARHWRSRYGVEIQKKFSLAAACIVFVLVGAPIALRFPRGGVGLVMGVGFTVFAIYYVGLIGGEALSDHGIISPFWAMWLDNIIFTIVGLILIARMGNEGVTGRGGNFAEMTDSVRHWFLRRRGSAA